MLVQLGQRAATDDIVDLLYECHGRIRKFLSFATNLAAATTVSPGEACDVASQIHRYFSLSFTLHLEDEDETIAAALVDHPETHAALAQMRADHANHDELVTRLVAAAGAIERNPVPDAMVELGAAAGAASAALEPHLALEERVIFPTLRRLPQATRDAMQAAMRARRNRTFGL